MQLGTAEINVIPYIGLQGYFTFKNIIWPTTLAMVPPKGDLNYWENARSKKCESCVFPSKVWTFFFCVDLKKTTNLHISRDRQTSEQRRRRIWLLMYRFLWVDLHSDCKPDKGRRTPNCSNKVSSLKLPLYDMKGWKPCILNWLSLLNCSIQWFMTM